MEATIKFKDGTKIVAEVNGDCYITESKPTFPKNLKELEISTEKETKTYEEAMLVECACVGGGYWFTFIEKPLDIKQAERIAELEEKNAFLEGCIMEMSEEVYK